MTKQFAVLSNYDVCDSDGNEYTADIFMERNTGTLNIVVFEAGSVDEISPLNFLDEEQQTWIDEAEFINAPDDATKLDTTVSFAELSSVLSDVLIGRIFPVNPIHEVYMGNDENTLTERDEWEKKWFYAVLYHEMKNRGFFK